MPAQSPTLSPTLSAITAGLRGSSSGMPASILPTMSAPTSAPLVKMPPPRRANTEISEPPKPRPIERVDRLLRVCVEEPGQHAVVAGHAEQREADDEHAGDRAAAERDVERRADAAARRLGDAGVRAHRHVHADEARRRREDAADREADRDLDVLEQISATNRTDADDGDRRVLAVRYADAPSWIGRRERSHRLVAGRQRQQRPGRQHSVRPPRGGAHEGDEDAVVSRKSDKETSLESGLRGRTRLERPAHTLESGGGSRGRRRRKLRECSERGGSNASARLLPGHPEAPGALRRAAASPGFGSRRLAGAARRRRRRRLAAGALA